MDVAVADRASAVSPRRAAAGARAAAALMLAAFFWAVSAAAYSGFIGKWGLRDESPRFSIDRVFDRTAEKPFVYRQLVPVLADAVDAAVSEPLKQRLLERLSPKQVFFKTKMMADLGLRFRYMIVCYAAFLAFFVSLFLLRRIALDAGASEPAALLAVTSLALAFPYLQTLGGYYYDSTELLFFSLAFLLAARGKAAWLILLALPATLNKETFFFFVPALYPLLRCRLRKGVAAWTLVAALAASGAVNLAVRLALADAPGEAAQLHLMSNFAIYLSPSSYKETELTYGVIGPAAASLATLLLVATVAWRGWPRTPETIRRHLAIAAAVNLPLFLAFGYAGEWRNLSLLFVGAVVVMAGAVDLATRRAERGVP